MKFTYCFVFVLLAVAACQAEEASQEGIWGKIGKIAKNELGKLAKSVGKNILNQAKDIISDNFRLKPTKEVQQALQNDASHEGIFDLTGDLIYNKAVEISQREPSHEALGYGLGAIPVIHEAENVSIESVTFLPSTDGPSHESIFGSLGKLVVKGVGKLIGGKAGDVIKTAGDVIGSLFFALPQSFSESSQESIVGKDDLFSQEGIFGSLGKIIFKGAGKLAGGVLGNVFDHAGDVLGNIFLSQGAFRSYKTIKSPAEEILIPAKTKIYDYQQDQENSDEVRECITSAEHNFTTLFNEYVKHGHACVAGGEVEAKEIFVESRKIVLEAIHRVEDAHQATGNCFKSEKKAHCLEHEIPALVKKHRKQVFRYGNQLAQFTERMVSVNNVFDRCLLTHLGHVRNEVYKIVNDFHKCLPHTR